MKKINLNIRKNIIILGIVVSFSISSINAFALDPIENGLTASQIVKDGIAYVQDGIKVAKTVISTAKSASALAKNLQNFDMSNFASKLSAVGLKQIGDTVTESIGIKRDSFTNPLTNGSQVVTDLKGFLKSNGENAIRNVLSDQATQSGTNPYISTSLKNVVQKVRSDSNNQIVVQLPFVAQKEICNSDNLKNIIKNGEPKTYINPKPAVKNVDIDRLCNADLNSETEGKASQVTFIGLAKAGYGGTLTNIALADPSNTPHGVSAALESKINSEYADSINNATNQYTSNGGIIGSQVCLDSSGNAKNFDATDPNKAFCNNLATSASSSAAVIKANIEAARLSPYLDILAKAQTPDSGSSDGCGSSDSGSTGSTLSDITCSISDISNSANSFLDIANSIIGSGYSGNGSNPDFTTNNTYAQLATSLDGVAGLTQSSAQLASTASTADKNYALGVNATVTAERIPEVIDLYKQARLINTEKLNQEVYTYGMLKIALSYTQPVMNMYKNQFINSITKTAILNTFSIGFFGGGGGIGNIRNNIQAYRDMKNTMSAIDNMNTAFNNLGKDIRSLISQMALNNYKEQQLNKLETLFQTTGARPQDNMDSIIKALDNTITDEQIGEITNDWNYLSRFISTVSSPTIDDMSTALFIPSPSEISAPFSKNNLETLRLRTYQMQRVNSAKPGNSTVTSTLTPLIQGFGFSNISKMDPDLPRKNYPFKVSSDSNTYSEKAYCDKIGVNICDTRNLSIIQNGINNSVYQLQNDPTLAGVNASISTICADPETEIQNYCSSSAGQNDASCRSTASTTALVNAFVANNCGD